jgi:hypothetical protein
LRYAIMLAVLVATHLPQTASGQAIYASFDLNTPAYSGRSSEDDREFSTEGGFSWRVGLLSKNFAECDRKHRRSVFITHQALNLTWDSPETRTRRYSATSIEAGVDRLVLDRTWLRLSLGVAGGFTFVTYKGKSDASCDSPFCNAPDTSGLISGFGLCEIPVSARLSGVLGLRGWVLGGGRENTFPFENGPVVSVGFQVN